MPGDGEASLEGDDDEDDDIDDDFPEDEDDDDMVDDLDDDCVGGSDGKISESCISNLSQVQKCSPF